MMKLITLLLSVFAVGQAITSPQALQVRGGGQIGPIDADMAVNLSKVAASTYVAGSATKFISAKTGSTAPKVVDLLTHELMALNALCTAVATAMYGLAGHEFDAITVGMSLGTVNALMLILDGGLENIVNTVMANKVFFLALYLPVMYIAFL